MISTFFTWLNGHANTFRAARFHETIGDSQRLQSLFLWTSSRSSRFMRLRDLPTSLGSATMMRF